MVVVEIRRPSNFIDFTGYYKGKVKVLQYKGNQKWLCLCIACGGAFTKDSRLVKKLHDYSCCKECSYKPENYSPKRLNSNKNKGKKLHDNKKYKGTKNISGHQWGHILSHAKKRGILVEVDVNYAQKLLEDQGFKCALSKEEIEHYPDRSDYYRKKYNHKKYNTASLDRIDSNLGYVEGNIHWIHKDVQRMKWDLTMDRFKQLCEKISGECGS